MFETEQIIYAAIAANDGVTAKEIAHITGLERKQVNHILYSSGLLHELCWQDDDFRWHGLVRQNFPHPGLFEFAGFYATAAEFCSLSEEDWLNRLKEGCYRISRNLNDTRGLIHSFLDARTVMMQLFDDLDGVDWRNWEIVFELRLKRSKHIRIYADVLVITPNRVFSLEFKMKDVIEPSEVDQAGKYRKYLQVVFGREYEIICALVLTRAADLFAGEQLPGGQVYIASADMLFNVFDSCLHFLDS